MTVNVSKEMSKDAPRRIVALPSEVHIPLPANTPQRALLESAALNCPVHKSLPPEIERSTKFFWEGQGKWRMTNERMTKQTCLLQLFVIRSSLRHSPFDKLVACRIAYCPRTQAKIKGAQIVASLSTTNFGVEAASLPQVIFSFGTAPE